jgi:hypothetical protein
LQSYAVRVEFAQIDLRRKSAEERSQWDTVDIIGLLVPVTYFLFLITEKLWPARDFPRRKGWPWIGIGGLLLISTIGVVTPLLIPGSGLTRTVGSTAPARRRSSRAGGSCSSS